MDLEETESSIDNENAHHLDCIGKVKSMQIKNFVTYESIIFEPSQNLNIIAAPNGSGKSALIAALVLGLGGDPKVISRASREKDYVKNGKTQATISVELFSSRDVISRASREKDYVKNGKTQATISVELFSSRDGSQTTHFQRSFDLFGKSKYHLDGAPVTKSQFVERVESFKVKIGNLCQFLPQERVQDFAKMNRHELLLNTLESVCSQKTVDDFEQLKILRKKQLRNVDQISESRKRAREVTTRLEVLSGELESSDQRLRYVEQIDLCKAKLSWLKSNVLQEEIREANHDLSLAKAKENECVKVYKAKMLMKKKLDAKQANMQIGIKIQADAVKKIEQEINANSAKTNLLNDTIAKAVATYQSKERNHSEYLSDSDNAKILLVGLEQDLENVIAELGTDEERNAKLSAVESELEKLRQEIAMCLKKRSEINNRLYQDFSAEVQMLKRRLQRLENRGEQKLMNLQTRYPHVYAAMQHVHNNIDSFQGKIYDPILLELTVLDPAHVKYLEDAIPIRDLLAFTCENKADVAQLSTWCVVKRWSVGVVFSPPVDSFDRDPDVPLAVMKKFGFTGYLMDLLQGPAPILCYHASVLNLHNIPYGTKAVELHTDAVPKSISCFYGGDEQHYKRSKSRYTDNSLLMQNDIRSKQLLYTNNEGEIQTTKRRLNELVQQSDQLRNERTAVEAKINEFEFRRRTIIEKRRAISNGEAQANEIRQSIKRQKKRMAEFNVRLVDLPNAKATMQSIMSNHLKEILELMEKNIKLLGEYSRANSLKELSNAKDTNFVRKNMNVQLDAGHVLEAKNQAKTMVMNIESALADLRRKHNAKVLTAKTLTCNFHPNDDNYPQKAAYDALPDDMVALRDIMIDLLGRIDCLPDVNPSVQREHEQLSQGREQLKSDLEEKMKIATAFGEELQAVYRAWYPVLASTVETINDHFSRYFFAMGYAGEILIVTNEDNDFDKFGLKILVQFRAGVPLQELDQYKQSGGERAVTIAAYTLSLQHVSHVPFRCVDEINQGMDSQNERKIFTMLLNETTQEGRSQYFFVTPKLLSGLPFNPNMTVHIIFNGTHMDEAITMNPK